MKRNSDKSSGRAAKASKLNISFSKSDRAAILKAIDNLLEHR